MTKQQDVFIVDFSSFNYQTVDPEPGSINTLTFIFFQIVAEPYLLWYLLAFVMLLGMSFFVSGAEAAFFSLSRAELSTFREDIHTPTSQRICRLMKQERKLLATILIANNFANVGAILVSTYILNYFAQAYEMSATYEVNPKVRWILEVVLITGIILLFGEIVPKVFATKNRLKYVKALSTPMDFLVRLFDLPARWLISLNSSIESTIQRRIQRTESNASLDDLRNAINLTATRDEHKDEKEILKGIVNFSNIPVKSIMRARVDVKAIEIHTPFDELVTFIQEHNYSRLPVFSESLDHIKGILHVKDILPYLRSNSEQLELEKILREAHFVPENKKIDVLLEEFKAKRSHMAVVVDEFGGTAGIVTLEDVIEEIFGEISDEFDSEDWVYSKISDDTYIFEGRISLIDVKRILELDDEVFEDARGDNDTLGGLILELHGKIPSQGEIIHYRNFELHVEGVGKNRITQVKMIIHTPETNQVENS